MMAECDSLILKDLLAFLQNGRIIVDMGERRRGFLKVNSSDLAGSTYKRGREPLKYPGRLFAFLRQT